MQNSAALTRPSSARSRAVKMRRATATPLALTLLLACHSDTPSGGPLDDGATSCAADCGADSASSGAAQGTSSGASESGAGPSGEGPSGTTGGEETTASGDATGAPVTYDPCPSEGPCRFMSLGDSVTSGYEGGYRIPLFRSVLAADQSITFVGSRMSGPDEVDGVPFPREHEGHDGFYIDATHSDYNIDDLLEDAISTHAPHIIALMIGTNDVARDNMADSGERLGLFLDHLIAISPDALVVLAQITPTKTDEDNEYVQAYNAEIPALVESRAAEGKHIILVDMYSAFTADPDYQTTLMYDNFHPNTAGDEVLAAVWYAAVESLLK